MNSRIIFRHRYEQIAAAAKMGSQGNLLDLPLALRQMLADGSPLIHQVNRDFHQKLTFTVGLSVRERTEEMASLGLPTADTHFLAMFPPNEPKREIGLKELLAFEVLKIDENFYTCLDLLDACANKLGGVHYDPKSQENQVARDISSLGSFLESHGLGTAFSTLLLLARVASAGLNSLYEATNS